MDDDDRKRSRVPFWYWLLLGPALIVGPVIIFLLAEAVVQTVGPAVARRLGLDLTPDLAFSLGMAFVLAIAITFGSVRSPHCYRFAPVALVGGCIGVLAADGAVRERAVGGLVGALGGVSVALMKRRGLRPRKGGELLRTERLDLRPMVWSDSTAMHPYLSDPEVVRYTMARPATTPRETEARVLKAISSQRVSSLPTRHFAVILRSDGRLIGDCGLESYPGDTRQGRLSFVLDRQYWSRGYATEAAREVLRYGFEELNLHRISASSHIENAASWRVLEKIGMRREGYFREVALIKGEWWDLYTYAMLDQEWKTPSG